MILEHALLHIRAGQSEAFEAAMRQARPLIAASPGFLWIDVRPAAEQPDLYLLTVTWADIAAHRDGFRASDRYKNWRDLLHGFYDPMPTITYFAESIL
ncbi:antibiotic biosynthesis monooxygenase [Sphingomonas aliaeris]|uniref:Antibiotic biosynthesis monooxygenase n=1 Tax=Sphingomonas aliaeris TaxID=2759526 RepID=A0A974NUG2_9SPHN|nr:antibiotic biosynthesis monooxygenase family protein [Sphingomonas aliaeris]QQV77159.1 antibiotic biosynthesis monooxygenase [Sphingomonas aliaeris]